MDVNRVHRSYVRWQAWGKEAEKEQRSEGDGEQKEA